MLLGYNKKTNHFILPVSIQYVDNKQKLRDRNFVRTKFQKRQIYGYFYEILENDVNYEGIVKMTSEAIGWAVRVNGLILRTGDGSTWINPNTGEVYPSKYHLAQNHPNPFNPSTTIELTLPKPEYVELKVYNILGKEVTIVLSKKLTQGNHIYTFDGKNLASGIYYYQLVAGNYRDVKKMILIK